MSKGFLETITKIDEAILIEYNKNQKFHDEKYKSYTNTLRILISILPIALILFNIFYGDSKGKNDDLELYKVRYFENISTLFKKNDSIVQNSETIKHVFNTVDRQSIGLLSEYGYSKVIEDYLTNLIKDTTFANLTIKNKLIKLIKLELKQDPYNQLKPEQKRLVKSLENSMKTYPDSIAVYNLSELNDHLRIQNTIIDNLTRQNNWSIPLSIVGAFLTLLFGLLPLVTKNKMQVLLESYINKNDNKKGAS